MSDLVACLHRGTDLRVPVLWLMGSDVTEQEILERRLAADGYRPDFAYALGVRFLAERDFARAAERFADADKLGLGEIGALGAYAMCRAGMRAQAAAVKGANDLAPQLRCWNH